jgi:K+-transporting ATPase ATPase B chain
MMKARLKLSPKPERKREKASPQIYRRAMGEAFKKLDPRSMVRNPVMFVVETGSLFTSVL